MADTILNRAVSQNLKNRGIKTDEEISAEQAVNEARRQSWQDALRAAAAGMVNKGMDAQTMAGFAVGRWLSDYLARGRNKAAQRERDSLYAQDEEKLRGNTAGPSEVLDATTSPALQKGLLDSVDTSNFSKMASTENMLDTVGLGTGKYSNPITQATSEIIAKNFIGPTASAGIDPSSIGQFFDKDKAITNMFRF